MSNNILLKRVQGVSQLKLEQFLGSDCTGSDGATSRVLTTTTAGSAAGDVMVSVDGMVLTKTTEYTISTNDITFLVNIFNEHKLEVFYLI